MARKLRINLFTVSIVLICIGIVMIFSATSIYAWEKYKDSFFFLKRHLVFLVIGAMLTFLAMVIDYRDLKRYSKPLLIAAFLLLILVLIPGVGREVSGARRWFRFKFISFQPSEFANLATIIYVADFIDRKGDYIKEFVKGFLPPVLVLGSVALLILLQPDLGTTLAIGAVVFIMLFVAGVRVSYLLSIILASLPLLVLLIFTVPYRRARILAFLNPWLDPGGSGFQIIQSQIALGSGGLFGVGLGQSRQKLFYLPAAHTDFIFSIIGEELGLLGTVGIIILFIIFIQQGLKVVKHSSQKFGYFLSLGLVSMISLKAIINIGVSCGVLPTKGLPLPFISYGGSSLIFDMVSVGILMNIARCGEYP
ncbi:MAG: cell division protein FtsW [Omnitrophica WOR_2 bacterium RBG_13_44_8b]|nr:MAG: cell division protein FtsW [Omnitrophica WOR_2 bacterium RBG_13_44_8b]